MTRVQRFIFGQLPTWARPDYPMLRYLRRPLDEGPALVRAARRMNLVLVILVLAAAGLAGSLMGSPIWLRHSTGSRVFDVLYFPLTIAQFAAQVFALQLMANVVAGERARGRWEEIKITSHGAEMLVRAHWAALLYRLLPVIALLMLPRLVFAARMLADVAREQGYYLDFYLSGTTPEIPLELAILMVAGLMTAALLQVPVLLALLAAAGLALSARLRSGMIRGGRALVFVLHAAVFVLARDWGRTVIDAGPWTTFYAQMGMPARWLGLFFMGTLGDQGLRFMDLTTTLQTWPEVHYAVLIGGALLAALVIEVLLTNALLRLAVRWASDAVRE